MNKIKKENIIRWEIVSKFIEKNRSAFTDFEIMRIKNIMLYGTFPKDYTIDLIRELCDELDLIPDEDNIYLAFIKELEDNFDIKKRNIIEVGGGTIPCLGRKIRLHQTTGSITIYDPKLLETYQSTERYKLVKEKFTDSTDLKNADLLIGIMPCKGTEALINQAIKNKKEFMVWLCEGGPHGDCFDFYEDEDEWLDSIISQAQSGIRDNNMGEFKIKYLERFSKDYPIISSKKIN